MKAATKAALLSLVAAAAVLARTPEPATPPIETPLPSVEEIERAVAFAETQACDAGRRAACYRLRRDGR